MGDRNIDSGKLPFRKEVEQQLPFGISLSVFLPTSTKKIVKDVSNSTGLSIDLPLSVKRVGI